MSSRRAPNNMGSISQRKDGLWEGKTTFKKPDGTVGRKTVYGRTSREVQAKVVALLSDIQRGLPVRSNERETVNQYLDRWLQGRRDLSENVQANYRSHLEKHIKLSSLGKMRLTGVQPADIRIFINTLLDSGLSNSTVRHILAIVSGGFRTAVGDGLVARNPVSLVKLPKPAPPKTDTLTPAEVRRLWTVAKDDFLYALWVLAPTLGCRQGELLALRWDNVTLDGSQPEIRIEASMKRVTGKGIVRGTPKTESAYRSIPLDDMHIQVLRQHRARQNETRLQAGEKWEDNDLVFCTSNKLHPVSFGKPLDARSITRRWKALLKRTGLPNKRFHDMRHTAFTHMAAAEVNPETIRQLAGHSDVRVTLAVYTHPTAEMKRRAVGVLSELYSQENGAEAGNG
jgi:integrase